MKRPRLAARRLAAHATAATEHVQGERAVGAPVGARPQGRLWLCLASAVRGGYVSVRRAQFAKTKERGKREGIRNKI